MIKTKWWCIALSLSAIALSACGGASQFDDPAALDVEAPAAHGASSEGAESVGQSQQALWNLCEKVRIEVTNRFEDSSGARPDIKVTRLSFYDADKGEWRMEGVGNQVIGYGDEYPFTEGLENVDGD
ncbi:MAG TPA: hypothetical protein VFK05_29675, partial [Polyangiaceae bacterium]|nr:hypothetical protein [Polyangiaceae bacterium]